MKLLGIIAALGACQASAAPSAPPESRGSCRDAPIVGGIDARFQPKAIASCPDVLDLHRGDGVGKTKGPPPIKRTAMPPWDNVAARDYACAYACAPAGATASLLAWSVLEDKRPLRNEYAAYVIAAPRDWTVVVMYRHAFNAWWNIATGPHERAKPVVHFDHAPTVNEIDAILDDNAWNARAGGFQVIGGGLVETSWPGRPKAR